MPYSYLTGRGSGALKIPKKSRFKESDRLFTLSSATGLKHAEARAPPPSNDDAFAIATALREVRGGGGKGEREEQRDREEGIQETHACRWKAEEEEDAQSLRSIH